MVGYPSAAAGAVNPRCVSPFGRGFHQLSQPFRDVSNVHANLSSWMDGLFYAPECRGDCKGWAFARQGWIVTIVRIHLSKKPNSWGTLCL
jgi:hypothetical protein